MLVFWVEKDADNEWANVLMDERRKHFVNLTCFVLLL